ncbi:MAG: hypothetical protein V3T08_09755 [Gemmatimonadota bacterium]
MFKSQVDTLEEIPEGNREHYAERNGKYEIQVEGMKTQADVDRVMESLRKERVDHDKAKARARGFGEHTPESIEALAGQFEDTKLLLDAAKRDGGPNEDDLEKLVENRTLQRVKPLERRVKQLGDEIQTLTGSNQQLVAEKRSNAILKNVLDAATLKDVAVSVDALPDVELWGERVFEVTEDGRVVSKDGVGVTPGLTPKEVFTDMKAAGQRRHWFGQTVGAGAGGGAGGTDTGTNPFSEKGFNLTKAAQLTVSDPARAVRLAKAAGREDLLPSRLRTPAS